MAEAAVLLVDDDAPIRRMLERTLAAEGYAVDAVADGGAALAAVERSVPDAIVLDVAMPGLDGLAVTRRLRAQGPARPDPAADRARRARGARRRARRRRRRLPRQAVRGRGADARACGRCCAATARPSEQLAFADLSLDAGDRHRAARRPRPRADPPRGRAARAAAAQRRAASSPASSRSRRCGAARARPAPNVVDRYVAYLRRKLGDPPLIHTVRGVGFRLGGDVSPHRRRARVAAAAAAAIVVAVVAARRSRCPRRLGAELHGSLDDTLRRRAADVARLAASAPALLTRAGRARGARRRRRRCSCRSSTAAAGSSRARARSAAACSRADAAAPQPRCASGAPASPTRARHRADARLRRAARRARRGPGAPAAP